MISFLLSSACCLFIFWLAYRLIFARERMYHFNRFYLLASLILSFLIPLIVVQVNVVEILSETRIETPASMDHGLSWMTAPAQESTINWICWLYVVGVTVMFVRFTHRLRLLFAYIRAGKKQLYKSAVLILHPEISEPFSFLNYMFLNRNAYESKQLSPLLIQHEMGHIRQKHTLDLFLLEILHCFCWFNPLLLLFQHAIRLNHEYLADESVTQELDSAKVYMHLLLDFVGKKNLGSPSSYFTFGQTKSRITMMNKSKNQTTMRTKQLFSIPLLVVMMWSFGQSRTVYVKVTPDTPAPSLSVPPKDSVNNLLIEYDLNYLDKGMLAYTLDPGDQQLPYARKKGQPDRFILAVVRGQTKVSFLNSQQQTITKLCKDLTQEERRWFWKLDQSNARYFHTSPAQNRPTDQEMQAFLNASEYGIWIDGVRVHNDELKKYTKEDIHSYFKSRLMRNAKNYGKHIFQLNLYTQQAFEQKYQGREAGYWLPITLNGLFAH
ncbi:MAG: M56 family metallopeptidase [Bacteroidota bacterium]